LIENESLRINELEQALVEKAGQLFERPALASDSAHYLKPKSAFVPLESIVAPRTGRTWFRLRLFNSCLGQALACDFGDGTKACIGSFRRKRAK
jgi:hypothetical protein